MNLDKRLTVKQLFFISLITFITWLILVLSVRRYYITAVETDALAMINGLFPYFWIILSLFLLICFHAFYKKDSPLWLHVILLAQFALMLFYTPFLVGGFSWSPDSLWHGGVANYVPSILAGANYPLTAYAQSYPFSFAATYFAERLFQINTVTYTLYIFPIAAIISITSLAYFFISRISDRRTAFIAMLLALPAWHYFEPHVSPFATGIVLLLTSLVLLTYKSLKSHALNLLIIVALVSTHPISPTFLGIYIFSSVIVSGLFLNRDILRNKISGRLLKMDIFMALFLVFFWLYWTFYKAAPNYIGLTIPISNILNLNFLNNLKSAFAWTAGGQGFIYPQISQLSLFIYALFLIMVLIMFFLSLKTLRNARGYHLVSLRLELALTALISAALSYLLFSASGERFLLGRGLIIFLLMGSVCVATYIQQDKSKKSKVIALAFILFLTYSFPVISYSKEAYNTFTPPAEEGLIFLSTQIDLSNKTVSMTSGQQLAAYADLTKGLNLTDFPPNLTIQQPDVIVLRINSYYFVAMRYDLSFSNNTFTQLRDNLANTTQYNRIFSNTQFEIYVKTVKP